MKEKKESFAGWSKKLSCKMHASYKFLKNKVLWSLDFLRERGQKRSEENIFHGS